MRHGDRPSRVNSFLVIFGNNCIDHPARDSHRRESNRRHSDRHSDSPVIGSMSPVGIGHQRRPAKRPEAADEIARRVSPFFSFSPNLRRENADRLDSLRSVIARRDSPPLSFPRLLISISSFCALDMGGIALVSRGTPRAREVGKSSAVGQCLHADTTEFLKRGAPRLVLSLSLSRSLLLAPLVCL